MTQALYAYMNNKIKKNKNNFGVHTSASNPGDGASDVVL
jgi:hypothetical protein